MSHPDQPRIEARSPNRRRFVPAALGAAVLGILVASWVGLAQAAAPPSRIVSSAHNAKLGKSIVVDAHGRTLYRLSPETVHHILCTGMCLQFWLPVTVRSVHAKLKAGNGVQGHLVILHRSDGTLQVTLRGLPLYTFKGDSAKGAVNGENIASFGGVWHAVTARSSSNGTAKPSPTPTPSPPTPAPHPGYSAY